MTPRGGFPFAYGTQNQTNMASSMNQYEDAFGSLSLSSSSAAATGGGGSVGPAFDSLSHQGTNSSSGGASSGSASTSLSGIQRGFSLPLPLSLPPQAPGLVGHSLAFSQQQGQQQQAAMSLASLSLAGVTPAGFESTHSGRSSGSGTSSSAGSGSGEAHTEM
jgi:hypothetical protein